MTAPLMFASVCLSFSGLWVWVCWRVWAFPHRVHSSFINLHQEGHMGLSREDHWGRDGWKDVTSFSPNPRNRADRRKSNPTCNFLFSLMVEMYLKTWITLWRQGKGGRREAWRKLLWADSPHKHTYTRTPCMQGLGRKQTHCSNWWTGSWTPSCWVFPSWLHTLCETSHEWWTERASTGKISVLCELSACHLRACHHAGPNIVRLRSSGMGVGYHLRSKGQVVSALNLSRKGRNGFRKYKETKRRVREKFYVRFATGGFTFKIHSNKTRKKHSDCFHELYTSQ